MQATRRTNRDRSDATREALVAAARALFIEQGYAAASTPQVAAAARVSRGALYHQFADKRALFRAVIAAEAAAVASVIEAVEEPDSRAQLAAGVCAYLEAMRQPGRCRLLLVEGPAVLGAAEMRMMDMMGGGRTLVEGLQQAAPDIDPHEVRAVAELLSAALDRAALASDGDSSPKLYEAVAVKAVLAVATAWQETTNYAAALRSGEDR